MPTVDVQAATYDVEVTCIVTAPQPGETFQYATGSITVTPFSPSPTFPDVPEGHQFFDEITWMADSGITNGYADGTFRPSIPLSRQAAAVFRYYMDL